MQPQIPLTRDLVLIGGGHTHALVLRKWAMRPLPGTRVTVINPGPTAPYSGMLPGHIAGHYTRDELEIDLVRLARFAGVRLILDRATGLDPVTRSIRLENRAPLPYDVASVDIGITAEMPDLPGFAEHATGAKPLDTYAARWQAFLATARATGSAAGPVAVIGAGVAGVELAMAMAHALKQATGSADVTVIEASDQLSGLAPATQARLRRALDEAGVTLRLSTRISQITADGPMLSGGTLLPAALTIGAAGARPHDWLQATPLPLTDGFIDVGPTLQATGFADLFATGDCAHLTHAPRPKAGVFAVREAPILYHNLRARLTGHPLRPFHPQKDYLKLISLGGKSALAERYGRPFAGPLLWQLKNRIDRKFIDKFHDLPAMPHPDLPPEITLGVTDVLKGNQPMCGGCGSKVGSATLTQALATLPSLHRPDVLTGAGDDAAVLAIGGTQQVITTDHLRAFTEDPALMARITAVHALGDVWSMGAAPQAALASIILPRMSDTLQRRTMTEIMTAATEVFHAAGAEIVGGHTTMGPELTIGFTVTGLTDHAITHAGAQPGDVLILTRPLGTGTLLAAEMQSRARGRDIAAVLHAMAQSQAQSASILARAHAMTDVTGFGLAGHLQAICQTSGTAAQIDLSALLFYDGALDLAATGIRSTLYPDNLAAAPVVTANNIAADDPRVLLLHDPQTAGGLLAAVAADQADALLGKLHAAAIPAARIGQLTDGPPTVTCR
ncbi:selenide, water dikinase SelD [Thalassovita taeanensis]|uniref:Selenophosphate synthase n=1 Tax=Thalassovita taeanensis TaxID=657014 RepID=A0A1H8YRQ0_9RHOB|nr:selenide, water dikinase SelD [Thalassovita taeanensis]SEP54846.1 selenophosphate synthase [Thalassovita taeanensis]